MPNKATLEVKELARNFLDKNYWPGLDQRWKNNLVQWPELQLLMAYGYGKPAERHEVSSPNGGPVEMLHRIERVIVNAEDAEDKDA